MLSGAYDMVVHSLKDMPTVLPEGLVLAAITERADPRDALVVRAEHRGCGGLAGLAAGSTVGTSSLRRCALVHYLFPGKFRVEPVRGNINTRLQKLDAVAGGKDNGGAAAAPQPGRKYDALILAAAGLRRLGLDHRIEAVLGFPYSAGQGALAVECRAADVRANAIARSASHRASTLRCVAERALLRSLLGGCQVPIGVNTRFEGDQLILTGMVASLDGKRLIRDQASGAASDAEAIGIALANTLKGQGAGEILKEIFDTVRPEA